MVRGEFWNNRSEEKFKDLIKTHKVIGMSSYQCFPNQVTNPHENRGPVTETDRFFHKYAKHVIAWAHCFRDPTNYLPSSLPRVLLSETDFYDTNTVINQSKSNQKEYDFVCSINDGEWNKYIRRLDIAHKWLNIMANEMGLKILVIGSSSRRDFSDRITCIGFQPWHKFIGSLNKARYLFNSSQYDASPRILIESMSSNVPILLNQNILGGWKYINKQTGMLFDPDSDVKTTVMKFMDQNRNYHPQQWVTKNVNRDRSAELLANTINSLVQLKWSDFVDAFIYINLDDRTDRKHSINQEFTKHGIPPEMVHRIPAVYDSFCGHLGCSRSHIKALELAERNGWKRFVIIEDDFIWNLPRERVLYMIQQFISEYNNNWDVVMFSTYWRKLEPTNGNLADMVDRVKYGSTTAGYMVNKSYLAKLLNNFREGEIRLTTEVSTTKLNTTNTRLRVVNNALDQNWRSLQQRDRFYLLKPELGKQSNIASSIMA